MVDSPPRTPLASQSRPLTLTPLNKSVLNDGDEQQQHQGNEENALNFANTPRGGTKKPSTFQSDVATDFSVSSIHCACSVDDDDEDDGASQGSVSRLKGWLDDFGKQNQAHYIRNNPNAAAADTANDSSSLAIQTSRSFDSDCESDLSVTRLKGWLDDFGKQNRAHYDKVNHIGKAPSGISLKKAVIRAKSTPAPPPPPQSVVTNTIRRNTDPSVVSAETKKGPAKTPVRYKSRFKKDEVQATNDGYASVKKIAAWLADDPTADKKMTTVRKGINVINKSRLFEKDLENVIIEENRIMKGSVSAKKEKFQSTPDEDDGQLVPWETSSSVSVSNKKKWLEGAFGKKNPSQEQAEDVADDSDSIVSMSVLEKKKWLQNAFKSGGDKPSSTAPSRFLDAASAPGGPSMTASRNERAATAKLMFQNRASSRRSLVPDGSGSKSSHTEEETKAAKHKWQKRASLRSLSIDPHGNGATKTELKHSSEPETSARIDDAMLPQEPREPPSIDRLTTTVNSLERSLPNNVERKWKDQNTFKLRSSPQHLSAYTEKPQVELQRSGSLDESSRSPGASRSSQQRASPVRPEKGLPSTVRRSAIDTRQPKVERDKGGKQETTEAPIESKVDDEETFDFRATREKLVKRSVQNGNPVKVMSKVQLRKQKFEKIQQDIRRKTGPMGQLKPTWEPAAPEAGPTTSYTKNFVDNIAPKKSFEDLP